MPAFVIRFIVLGEIPGTNLVITFWAMIFVLTFLLALFLAINKLNLALRFARAINPFFGSAKGLARVDLISV
ncbi:MAG: hypothetical protein AAB624_01310 [Patescibacteria group bacterium]